MKNVTMRSALCAVVLSATGYLGYHQVFDCSESNMFMDNVEALAAGEGGYSKSWDCWSNVKQGDGVWICGDKCFWDDESNGRGKPHSTCESDR